MRLINVKTLKFEEFHEDEAPSYAVLSHTWGNETEELTFHDIQKGTTERPGVGSVKLRGCCHQARKDGIGYIWIDTCCIDKTNLVELSEAINSMFRWYQRATICYAYLSDVPSDQDPRGEAARFRTSRWFRRGWTLQELLAPRRLVFYSSEWHRLGTKARLRNVIEQTTGIPQRFLTSGRDIKSASIAQRMSWAAPRRTTRPEDLAYCLLGLFGIAMPMIYGEGGEQAFFRLQEQIMRSTRDHSILAWGLGESGDSSTRPQPGRFFATAPCDFMNSGVIVPRDQSAAYLDSLDISGGSLRVSLSLHSTSTETVGLLNCGPEGHPQQIVAIPLEKVAVGGADEYVRPRGRRSVFQETDTPHPSRSLIYIRNDNEPDTQILGQYIWAYDDFDFADVDLELIDVVPRSSWRDGRSVIIPTTEPDGSTVSPTLVRLRHGGEGSQDFILILELTPPPPPQQQQQQQQNAYAEAHHCVAVCSRDTPSEELAGKLRRVTRKAAGREEASNGFLDLRLTVKPDTRHSTFTIRSEKMLRPPNTTVDATVELMKPDLTLEIEGILQSRKWGSAFQRMEFDKTYDVRTICGQPPLLWASENGCVKMAKLLIDNGVDVAAENNGERRAPLIAASENGHADVIQLLIATGKADINMKDGESGRAPLSWAAERGHMTVVQLLLKTGADVDAEDKDGRTASSFAAEGGYQDIAQLLLGNNAMGGRTDAAIGHTEDVQGKLDDKEQALQVMTKQLADLEKYRVRLHDVQEDACVVILDKIWHTVITLVEGTFRLDCDEDVLADSSRWSNLRTSSYLKHATTSMIPIPQSNSQAAKGMRISAILAIACRALCRHLFSPVYLLDTEADDHLIRLLRLLEKEDSANEAHLRAILLAILPERQTEQGARRVKTVVREVASIVEPLLSPLQYEVFCAGFEDACRLAREQWMRIQLATLKIEPYFGPPYDDFDWQVLELPELTAAMGADDLPETPEAADKSISDVCISDMCISDMCISDDGEIDPDEILLVAWPTMCSVESGDLLSITQGLVISKEQARPALEELRTGKAKQG